MVCEREKEHREPIMRNISHISNSDPVLFASSSFPQAEASRSLRLLLSLLATLLTLLGLLGLILVLDKHESHMAATAVLTVALVRSHESVAARGHALPEQTSDLAVVVDLVVVENGELHALVLVGNTLRSRVDLLLVLLATTPQAENKVKSALLLDVVISKGVTVLKLLTGKDKALLIRGDALLVLDLRLHVVDAVSGLDIKSDGLARQGLHENLHG